MQSVGANPVTLNYYPTKPPQCDIKDLGAYLLVSSVGVSGSRFNGG
jgi:hypothetical protein